VIDVEVGLLRLLFPTGIPVESYPAVPGVCRLATEARHLTEPTPDDGMALSRWLTDDTVHSDGARTNIVTFYDRYVAWRGARHVLDRTPGCAHVIRQLRDLGIGSEHTPEGWCVVDRRLV